MSKFYVKVHYIIYKIKKKKKKKKIILIIIIIIQTGIYN